VQPRHPLRDDLFVGEADRVLLGLRFGPAFDVLQDVEQELDGAPIAFGRSVDELLDDCLTLAIFLRPPSSAMTTGSFSASVSNVDRFFAPGGRPRGLPDWPLLKRVWRGGLP